MTLKECIEKAPDGKWRRKGTSGSLGVDEWGFWQTCKDGDRYDWCLTAEDVTAEDWEVVE
jgi:hypothetical protein